MRWPSQHLLPNPELYDPDDQFVRGTRPHHGASTSSPPIQRPGCDYSRPLAAWLAPSLTRWPRKVGVDRRKCRMIGRAARDAGAETECECKRRGALDRGDRCRAREQCTPRLIHVGDISPVGSSQLHPEVPAPASTECRHRTSSARAEPHLSACPRSRAVTPRCGGVEPDGTRELRVRGWAQGVDYRARVATWPRSSAGRRGAWRRAGQDAVRRGEGLDLGDKVTDPVRLAT
jgi:hypothetical protein